MSKPMKVVIRYGDNGAEREPLSASDLQLISDALNIVSPDSRRMQKRAKELALDFEILSELAEGQ